MCTSDLKIPPNCSCLVWDFGSRNKKRGIPRALWYALHAPCIVKHMTWQLTLQWVETPYYFSTLWLLLLLHAFFHEFIGMVWSL